MTLKTDPVASDFDGTHEIEPGEVLTQMLRLTGVSMTALSKEVGITMSYLSHMLAGRRKMPEHVKDLIVSTFAEEEKRIWNNLESLRGFCDILTYENNREKKGK